MLNDISRLFRGQAHFKILQILSQRITPVRIRTLTELSGMYIRSIELGLAFLVEQRVVIRTERKGLILYSLNRSHSLASLLLNMFSIISDHQMIHSNLPIDRRAQKVLEFADSALKVISKAKL